MESYCLYCKSGQEGIVIDLLKRHGYTALAPLAVRNRPGSDGLKRAKARLLPGYVFFDAEEEPDWDLIRRCSGVLKILHYDDGKRALRDSDLAFLDWLKRYDGFVDVSQVVKVGTKIAFVGGPLIGMEAQVMKVNKGRRLVQIAIGNENGFFQNIWCPIEYIEENADFDLLHRAQRDG